MRCSNLLALLLVSILLAATPVPARAYTWEDVEKAYRADEKWLEWAVKTYMDTNDLKEAIEAAYALAASRPYVDNEPPGVDIVQSPKYTFYHGGDCEDKAILFAALVKKWAEIHGKKSVRVAIVRMNIKWPSRGREGHTIAIVYTKKWFFTNKVAVIDPSLYFSQEPDYPWRSIPKYREYLKKAYGITVEKAGAFEYPSTDKLWLLTLYLVTYLE
ncbi:hypothetical protein P8X34_10250 [Pyrococcus kukulkanii]|uniref:Transglutaminase-like domain-containing protein n=1 Tax=Pyrococcus kukulkanii TaxID=1609559 RepID=A0ABV4T8Z9_9EURY